MKGFIMRHGSGTGKAFAVIGVAYPEGSVCTCTDGTKTLKLKDTSGQGFFLIPYAGTWTVTCTDGVNTKAKSVEITTEGQTVSVELSYRYYLFKSGEGVADNWGIAGNATTVQKDNDAIAIKSTSGYGGNNNIKAYILADLSKYKTLKATIKTTVAGKPIVGVFGTDVPGTYTALNSFASATKANENEELSLDISSFTGSQYVGIYAVNQETLYMYDFWLE